MNIQHLEMMRVMMERVAAGSWEPVSGYLGNLIQNVPREVQFDLSDWIDPASSCGFSACAVGHACLDEEFRKLGWEWSFWDTPRYKNAGGWFAVRKFFDIGSYTDELLFQNIYYQYELIDGNFVKQEYHTVKPKEVADRISELMELGEESFKEKYKQLIRKLRD